MASCTKLNNHTFLALLYPVIKMKTKIMNIQLIRSHKQHPMYNS